MPFTPSHVAAVLPFAGTRLVPAGLVVGSMAPDLFFYVPLPIPRDFTHSWAGVVTVDLVFGALLFALWRAVFRRPVFDFLPLPVRRRLATLPPARIRPASMRWASVVLLVLASLLIGTVTHVAWDAFTHLGWPVTELAPLRVTLGPLPLYEWLQYGSSLLGALLVVGWAIRWLVRTRPADAVPTRLTTRLRVFGWSAVALAGLVVALAVWANGTAGGLDPVAPHLVFLVVTIGLAGAALVAVVLCLVWLGRTERGNYSERSTATTLPSTSA